MAAEAWANALAARLSTAAGVVTTEQAEAAAAAQTSADNQKVMTDAVTQIEAAANGTPAASAPAQAAPAV